MIAGDLCSKPNTSENPSVAALIDRPELGAPTRNRSSRTILGINFFAGGAREAVELGLKGGLVVAPAAPGLVNLPHDEQYRLAVSSADIAITDSSLMTILWNLTRGDNVPRVSGLEYLTLLLKCFRCPTRELPFFVMPSKEAAIRALKWLKGQDIESAESHYYVAPLYGTNDVEDFRLLELLERLKPTQIIIGVGGGTQEKLGLFLRERLSYRPGIHCIGAAIGFLSGDQVRIPKWADRLYLGWLFRCLANPKRFIPRYWKAGKLFWQMIFAQKVEEQVRENPHARRKTDEDGKNREIQATDTALEPPAFSSQLNSRVPHKPRQTETVGI